MHIVNLCVRHRREEGRTGSELLGMMSWKVERDVEGKTGSGLKMQGRTGSGLNMQGRTGSGLNEQVVACATHKFSALAMSIA